MALLFCLAHCGGKTGTGSDDSQAQFFMEDDGDDWIKQTPRTGIRVTDEIDIESPETELLGAPRKVLDATVHDIQLPFTGFSFVCWWQKGSRLFGFNREKGIVYLLSVPGFKLLKALKLNRPVSNMKMSGQGLLVVLKDLQEVRIIDPVSMKYKGAIFVPGCLSITSSPNSDIAVSTTATRDDLTVIDLKNKK
ncbi:MAG: hypothetical protein GY765_09865, partial [bacterium]|nr:hypothetical protein [bacterium]